MNKQKEIPLVTAAARLKRGYNVVLGLVLRGEIEGQQDERGRWMVSERSLDAWNTKMRALATRAAAA